MGITIGSNIASLGAQRQLGKASDNLQSIYEKLSSGQRINHASDDAAGLSVSLSLNLDSRVYTQGIRNVSDGVSLLSIADGALDNLSTITQRQLELSEQAANGSYSLTQRKAMDLEANALVDEYNRIVATTSFNGIGVFNGTLSSGLQIQSGYSTSGNVTYSVGNQLSKATGNGTFQTAVEYTDGTTFNPISVKAADLNGDGKQDLVAINFNTTSISVYIGNGDGTFQARVSFATGRTQSEGLALTDINGDGAVDIISAQTGSLVVSLGNGNGSFRAEVSYASSAHAKSVAMGDINHDGIQDAVVGDTAGILTVFIGNANGSFNAASTYTKGNVANPRSLVSLGDLNNDGNLDIVTHDGDDGTLSILYGNADGSFKARITYAITSASTVGSVLVADENHDGIADIIATDGSRIDIIQGNGDGTFKAIKSYATNGAALNDFTYSDLNGDGVSDIVAVSNSGSKLTYTLLGNSDGSFSAVISQGTNTYNQSVTTADLNGDGVLDLAITDSNNSSISISIANTTNLATIGRLNLLDQGSARSALDTLRGNLDRIQLERGLVGANLQRMASVTATLQTSKLGTDDAYSKIMDVDFASTTSELTKTSILQQAAAAVLGQANQAPSLAVKLLS